VIEVQRNRLAALGKEIVVILSNAGRMFIYSVVAPASLSSEEALRTDHVGKLKMGISCGKAPHDLGAPDRSF
jgi:hypothetical protein